MSKILVVDDEPNVFATIQAALADEGHTLRHAASGAAGLQQLRAEAADLVIADLTRPQVGGLDFLKQLHRAQPATRCLLTVSTPNPATALAALRERVCDFLLKPLDAEELRQAVRQASTSCPANTIEMLSALPEWVELRIPCDLAAVGPLQRLITKLAADLAPATCEALCYAFREMLNNAIEHGCKLDPRQRVQVTYVRLKHVIICWIKDPGEGFDPGRLAHAAINNPSDDPLRHLSTRSAQGMRAGGFGILTTSQLVDELVYNERHNELLLVKYLSTA